MDGRNPCPSLVSPRGAGGRQLPPVMTGAAATEPRRDATEDLLAPGIFLGLDGDLGRMVEKVWNDERKALRRGRTANELFD